MFESFPSLTPFSMVVAIVLIVSAARMVTSVAEQLRKFGQHRQDLEFKREMVERGLSIEEIKQLAELRSPRSDQ